MSAAASPAALPRSPSTARRQQAYPASPDRQQYTPSRTTAPTSPRRSLSQSQVPSPSHYRTPSGAQQGQLANVARRDFEQSNVARPTSSTRRSDSRDRMQGGNLPSRADSMRSGPSTSSRHGHSRYNSDAPTPAPAAAMTNGTEQSGRQSGGQQVRRRTTIDATTGHWELGKTIGAGSMGKVKLARNKETGEQVAVKIVPRQSTDEHRTVQERERADHSKEVRTAREAAIVTLVDHPYICGMRDVVRTHYHWYMLFEYVNGGQMLDYIISHGRLKEKQARKFGRQIASALDYCHRNSIVHRDLKIENILISKTGDIKIIDFGLSNTFSPKSYLKTFCGSLYFAAPELLQAKQYTGPEVDVWSFGIVLYVLVCGKVPFDDQSMPQLHAKIKKGVVEYPPWLTAECRTLIARMLVTDPSQRASLAEIMNHPWMTKGFGGAPENYLPPRKPLQLPLDQQVIQKMEGFDFGTAESIEAQLTKIIESEDYQRAVRNFERRGNLPTPEVERKRGVFDFYKRRNSTTSRDTLSNLSSEAVQLGTDPINAFSPLISIYFLAKEKIDREHKEANPGALAMPSSPGGEKTLKLPDLPAPEAAYTNSGTYEMPGEKPTGGRTRPRARTHGEDEVADEMDKLNVRSNKPPPSPQIVLQQPSDTPSKKEGTGAVGLLRRFSQRRHREPERRTPPPPAIPSPQADLINAPRMSFNVQRTRDREPSNIQLPPPDTAQTQKPALLSPLAGTGLTGRIGLGRSASVNSGDAKKRLGGRRGVSDIVRTPTSSHGFERPESGDKHAGLGDAASDVETSTTTARVTAPASRAKSLGHARRESIQARRARREMSRTTGVPEETDKDLQDDMEGRDTTESASPNGIKPVYLKGLFSVSTTSSKPLPVIRSDIIRVLRQLGVEYREIKGGFSCRHAPSIDLHRSEAPEMKSQSQSNSGHRRKISFGNFMGGGERERDDQRQPITPTSSRRDRHPDHSFTGSEGSDSNEHEEETAGDSGSRSTSRKQATLEPGTSRPAGETSTHVQSDLGESMVLRFEIFVVKVPLLSLHGIQFKKVDGGTWQYKNMAQTILNDLRL